MDGVIKLCEDLQVGEGTPPAYVRGGSVSLPRTHKHSNTLCACVRCSPTEDVVMLVIAWLLKAAKMAEFTKVRCHDMIPWVRMRWRAVALLLWQFHRCWGSDRSGILCVCVCVCVCVSCTHPSVGTDQACAYALCVFNRRRNGCPGFPLSESSRLTCVSHPHTTISTTY